MSAEKLDRSGVVLIASFWIMSLVAVGLSIEAAWHHDVAGTVLSLIGAAFMFSIGAIGLRFESEDLGRRRG